MKKLLTILLGLPVLAALGCEAPELPQAATAPAPAPAVEEPKEEVIMVAGAPGEALPEIETPVTDVPRKFESHDPIKGRRSRRAGGYLGAVGGARFHAEYQMIINNIDHANQLYWAETGDWPKSHEEFMEKIIKANNLTLPEIEPQHEYIYVPEQGQTGLQIRLRQSGTAEAAPAAAPADAQAAEPAEDEPSPDIRTRAAQVGEQGNKKIEEHGLAPGGLVPVGGLDE